MDLTESPSLCLGVELGVYDIGSYEEFGAMHSVPTDPGLRRERSFLISKRCEVVPQMDSVIRRTPISNLPCEVALGGET